MSALDLAAVREAFPALHQQVNGHPLVYLDNAATLQMPRPVMDAVSQLNMVDRANVHRGVHELSQRASAAYDSVRQDVCRLLGTSDETEIVFTSGTTAGINLFASSWGGANLGPGDEVVVTAMEHHANLVPWQMLCERTGATLKHIPFDDSGTLRMDVAADLIGPNTKLVGVVHTSNALGTVNPVAELAGLAHAQGALLLVDGAQAVPHGKVDVAALGADVFVFSAHKIGGPFGTGALWARKSILDAMPPWQGGGDMIARVRLSHTEYNVPPLRFEAGTPNIAGVVGMGAAIRFMEHVGPEAIAAWEAELLQRGTERLAAMPRVRRIGTAAHKASVLAFVVDGAHPLDVGTMLDQKGIAIRTGHHCAEPVMDFYGVSATARASFAYYNTLDEVDRFADALERVIKLF